MRHKVQRYTHNHIMHAHVSRVIRSVLSAKYNCLSYDISFRIEIFWCPVFVVDLSVQKIHIFALHTLTEMLKAISRMIYLNSAVHYSYNVY